MPQNRSHDSHMRNASGEDAEFVLSQLASVNKPSILTVRPDNRGAIEAMQQPALSVYDGSVRLHSPFAVRHD